MLHPKLPYGRHAATGRTRTPARPTRVVAYAPALHVCLLVVCLPACSDDSSSDVDALDHADASTQEPSPAAEPSPAMEPEPNATPMDTPPQPSSTGPSATPIDDAGRADTDAAVSIDGGTTLPSLSDASTPLPDAAVSVAPDAGAPRDAGAPSDANEPEPDPESTDASMPLLDAGTAADAGAPEVKRVFATSLRYNALLGGPDGADAVCVSHASAANLPGTYKAWLSTASVSVTERFVAPSLPYARLDGALIAQGLDDLLDGMLLAPINLDEFGDPASGDVWTGTLADGTGRGPEDCNGFDANTGSVALCGSTFYLDSRWTESLLPACSTLLRLFCFEQ